MLIDCPCQMKQQINMKSIIIELLNDILNCGSRFNFPLTEEQQEAIGLH